MKRIVLSDFHIKKLKNGIDLVFYLKLNNSEKTIGSSKIVIQYGNRM